MAKGGKGAALDIDQDLRLQRREWAWQRVGDVALALILLAALLGVFGPGPLSWASVEAEGIRLEYRRFGRLSPTTLTVEVDGAVVRGGQVAVSLPRRYLEDVRVEGITPEPASSATVGEAVRYAFDVASSGDAVTIEFELSPDGFGPATGWVAVEGGGRVEFWQFVYP